VASETVTHPIDTVTRMTLLDEHRHRFTRAHIASLVEAGSFNNWRCELIAGELIDVSPMSSRQAEVTRRIHSLLNRRLSDDRFLVGCQQPVGLDDWSEPEPDVWVAHARPGGYMDRHPEVPDMVLVVEVGWSSIRFDRGIKLPLYASSGVPEVWLFDVDAATVEVFTNPSPSGFLDRMVHALDGRLMLPDESTVNIADLLT
jgi:Uma2 family endonuclease